MAARRRRPLRSRAGRLGRLCRGRETKQPPGQRSHAAALGPAAEGSHRTMACVCPLCSAPERPLCRQRCLPGSIQGPQEHCSPDRQRTAALQVPERPASPRMVSGSVGPGTCRGDGRSAASSPRESAPLSRAARVVFARLRNHPLLMRCRTGPAEAALGISSA